MKEIEVELFPRCSSRTMPGLRCFSQHGHPELRTEQAMLRRTKIVIAAYCFGAIAFLVLVVSLVLQFTDWWGRPERYGESAHQHHHEEDTGPEATPAETYAVGDRTYLKVPATDQDFDVTDSSVDLRQILHVNLDLEKFPDLKELRFVSADEKPDILPDEDAVLGVSIEGEEKAYPIRMLNYHVILNDLCAGNEIAVVWDFLTLTPKVFRRRLEGNDTSKPVLTFGKVALLYKGCLLLYDEPTRSLWWPPDGTCLAGKLSGTVLREYPFLLASWEVWKRRHPKTAVLSTDTPFSQKYQNSYEYQRYYATPRLPVPVEEWDARKSPFKWSEPVIVLKAETTAKAYPLSVIARANGIIEDTFAGRKVVIQDPEFRPPYPTDDHGQEIPYAFGAWFLWSVRYPDIEIYSPEGDTK